ncbi:MAG: hypothetical protein WAW61_07950 [Methylococcaceae bacterium]
MTNIELPINRNEERQRYMDYLKAKSNGAKIDRFPAKGNIYHAIEVDSQYFYGTITVDGPAIVRGDRRHRYERGWVQLGVAEMCFTSDQPWNDQLERSWFICKYGPGEARVPLDGLSPDARHAVAHEFGIPIRYWTSEGNESVPEEFMEVSNPMGELFYLSPSFQSLCEFAQKHPRKAKKWESGAYLGDWGEAARNGGRS